MKTIIPCVVVACAIAVSGSRGLMVGQAPPTDLQSQVDTIFSRWNRTTPGCAVGAAVKGRIVVRSAYGIADFERSIPNTPTTVFDAGSVAKQFTAFAVLLLERDGKLSLNDPVHKYVPELPDYGAPITIRQMLNHTSGLREWNVLATIAGIEYGTFENGYGQILDLQRRQRSLNFAPGTRWSYSNSGY
ncbi:MAG TPA: serine hydrolase domain-containing protein, partial [Terriglobia bacterium]|nr:serine hydrolase domain-containing protein [Terriglobia bacterium]